MFFKEFPSISVYLIFPDNDTQVILYIIKRHKPGMMLKSIIPALGS
jgi:hypothetical protein